MNLLSGLEGIFLDFYGTIAAGDRAAVETVCARVVAEHHIPLTPAELALRWGRVFFQYIDRHNGDSFHTLTELECLTLTETLKPLTGRFAPVSYVDDLVAYWRNPPLYPEVQSVLASLPVPVCCVSNVDTDDLTAACNRHGLQFDDVVTSQDARSYKPDSEIFRLALDRTGWSPQRIVHVGDSLQSDVIGAHSAGIRAVWVCRSDRILDIGQADPEWTIHDLSGLSDLKNN